jgi:hypothetical protein
LQRALLLTVLLLTGAAFTESPRGWLAASDGTFTVLTRAEADSRHLHGLFSELRGAARDLRLLPPGWTPHSCPEVRVYVHPDLNSFTGTTRLPWFMLASADRTACELHLQRLEIIRERSTIAVTVRHELFHLAQPADWPRWLAEGRAMLFAGEQSAAPPLNGLSEARLDQLLAAPHDPTSLARAVATARAWALRLQ